MATAKLRYERQSCEQIKDIQFDESQIAMLYSIKNDDAFVNDIRSIATVYGLLSRSEPDELGADQFKEFIQKNKKDFILFQLEILMKDAGTDITRKNDAVNRIAESLSKISKAEDFTKQQEYIRQCSDILKIDEHGLTNLVNKYRRDNLSDFLPGIFSSHRRLIS